MMSQKAKRGSVAVEEKSRTDSPVKDMKKKAAANAEKERAASEKAATDQKPTQTTGKPATDQKPAQNTGKPATEQKPAQNSGKSTPAANQGSAKPPSNQNGGKSSTAVNQNGGKTAPEATQISGKAASTAAEAKPTEKPKDDGKADKVEKPKQTVLPEPAKVPETAKQNGSDKAKPNGTDTVNGNGTGDAVNGANGNSRGSLSGSEGVIIDLELAPAEDDELFPELAYEDGSDEDNAAGSRSRTRRDQVKPTRTPETPRPISIKPTAEEKSEDVAPSDKKADTRVLRLRDEYSPSPRKLRSADIGGDDKKDDEKQEDDAGKDAEVSVKRDTNFSKSRIKVSPYRRSTRLQDSILANYTGNNTTMEMDISEASELASTSQADPALETSYASRRSIRGRRSYKLLGEFVPTPSKNRETITLASGSRPTVHVVGRKRKTADDEEIPTTAAATVSESTPADVDAAPVAVKRVRLLERVVTPFASLVRRTVASSTPLPARRSQAIVGINSDLPLHGAVELVEPESLPAPAEHETLKTPPVDLPLIEAAAEARENPRQKCAVM